MPGDVRCSPCAGNGRVFAAVFPHPRSPAGKTGKQGRPGPHACYAFQAWFRTHARSISRIGRAAFPHGRPGAPSDAAATFPAGRYLPGRRYARAEKVRRAFRTRTAGGPRFRRSRREAVAWGHAAARRPQRRPGGAGWKKEKTAVAEKGETGEGGKAPSRPGGAGLIWKEETDRAGRTMRVSSVERFRLFLRNRRGLVENAVYSTARGRAFHPSRGFGRF